MFMLEVTQKIVRSSMEVMVMELGIRKWRKKDLRVQCSYKHGSREYTLQEENNSTYESGPSKTRGWLFGKEKPKEEYLEEPEEQNF